MPFYAAYYLNGHDIIAPMLVAEGVPFRMKDNAFVSVADPDALQSAAERIDPRRIANIFGWRIAKRTKGKHQVVLDRMEHSSSHIGGQSAADLHQAVLDAHHLTASQSTRNPLAYDLRKLRAHGLIERPDNPYVYALSDHGRKAAAMLVIVRNRILRPIAGSLFDRPPQSSLEP